MMSHIDLIEDGLHLRRPKKSDIKDRFVCGRTEEFVVMLGGEVDEFTSFSMTDAIDWYEKTLSNPNEWAIQYKNKCIGIARLTENQDRSARYAIAIFDDECIGRGIGTKITRMILDYAFNHKDLNYVDLKVLDYNERAIACYQKVGFRIKECLHNSDFINGQWVTDLIMEVKKEHFV
jgi:RimJ/RimL family protein N-acetyltransferase